MPSHYWFWVVWLLTGLVYELWAIWGRPGPLDTLSEFTGWVLRTNTALGMALLAGLMALLAAWYPAHVRDLSRKNAEKNDRA